MALTKSIREKIAGDIVDSIKVNSIDPTRSFTIKSVTREPVVIEDLAATQIPLVFVESADETREDISMGGSAITRMGTIQFILHLYVTGSTRDSNRNTLLEIIDSALEADRTRNGNALDTQIIKVALIQSGEAKPYASLEVTVECTYQHIRGAS